jgi:hypothetical protein
MPRPTKYNKETLEIIRSNLLLGLNRGDAAILAGVFSPNTIAEWMNGDLPREVLDAVIPEEGETMEEALTRKKSEFAEMVKTAEIECKKRMVALVQVGAQKDPKYASWFLERKHRDEYAGKQIIEGQMNGTMETRTELSEPQFAELRQALLDGVRPPEQPAIAPPVEAERGGE